MTRSLYSPPEPFSLQPLLNLLPVKSQISRLEGMTSSLYARSEKVAGLLKAIQDSSDLVVKRRLQAEERMLKTVLDWIGSRQE